MVKEAPDFKDVLRDSGADRRNRYFMLIPATMSHDVFLRALLTLQAADFKKPVAVEDVIRAMPKGDRDEHSSLALPKSVLRDIRFLERHRLLTFDNSNPHVKLTSLGVYAALLFEPLS